MPANYDTLLNWKIPEIRQTLTKKDTMLYAFSVGLGQDQLDEKQLAFVYEKQLKAMPSMAVVMGYPGFWLGNPGTGVDAVKLVHGEQSVVLHRPIPVEGEFLGRSKVLQIIDRGEGKGALLYSQREIIDLASNETVATVWQSTFLRGDGGIGGPGGTPRQPHPEPQREPDLVVELATRPEQAIIYRLNGDMNPLHIDPEVGSKAGFPKPILHGLCTYGVVTHALLRGLCDYDPARFGRLDLRFSSPVYPGETIRTEIWHEEGGAAFRAKVVERDKQVVSNGLFRFA
jgi:acyl dehydratase